MSIFYYLANYLWGNLAGPAMQVRLYRARWYGINSNQLQIYIVIVMYSILRQKSVALCLFSLQQEDKKQKLKYIWLDLYNYAFEKKMKNLVI